MEIRERKLKGIYEVITDPLRDDRGYMARLFDDKIFNDLGLNSKWVQQSRSHTKKKNTVRGLHISLPPSLEGKCAIPFRGEMQWVVVDIRKNSETFGQWDSVVLSGKRINILYAQTGFAHGCLSLSNNCDLLLLANNYYSDVNGTGILWNDKELNIEWKIDYSIPIILSEKDRKYSKFKAFREKHGGV